MKSCDVRNISYNKNTKFIVYDEEKKAKCKCELIQQTEWLLVFKNIVTKRVICVRKVDFYLNSEIIKVAR